MTASRWLRHPLAGYIASLGFVGAVTGLIALVRLVADVGNASMLYLLAVMAAALFFGSRPAVLAAVAAFLTYNFFFVQPHYTFEVADDDEWIALGLLLITGVTTGQLAASLRERAREAEDREEEAVVMYDVVRLMGEVDLQRALTAIAERLRGELNLAAVFIATEADAPVRAQADLGDSEAVALGRAAGLPQMLLGGGEATTGATRSRPGRWIRIVQPALALSSPRHHSDRALTVPVSLAGRREGSVVLVRKQESPKFGEAEDRLLSAVGHQLGLSLERLRLQREATEAEVLRRTDELRTALINAVSHDLRTPLASIIASAGSLLQDEVQWSDEDRHEFEASIVQEAERLNRLVGNLLDLSRIEAGTIRPEKGWYDLGSLVNEVAGRLRRVTAGHVLTLDVPEGLPTLSFDYVEIDQVLSNLIENAAKYTPADSEIAVAVRANGGETRIEVTDNGPGIPVAALAHLFKPFFRGGANGRVQGSGLGLAVAKGLVEAHGGRMWAENRDEGGARLVFTLPVGERPAAVA